MISRVEMVLEGQATPNQRVVKASGASISATVVGLNTSIA